MNASVNKNLRGKVVLVTRPQHQSHEFILQIEQHGAKALLFPTIEIQQVELDAELSRILMGINGYDIIIFTSANAVNYGVQLLQRLSLPVDKLTAKVAVIGKATYTAAVAAKLKVSIQPAGGYNSDALLALPELQSEQVKSKRVLIMRGRNGLDTLLNTLTQRGAIVEIANVYLRSIPEDDIQLKRQQLSQNWSKLAISDITVTSNESLQNLYDMLETPGKNEMLNAHLIVPSLRCEQLAKHLGFKSVSVAQSAINQHMMEAISII